jgi:hypothetical protein
MSRSSDTGSSPRLYLISKRIAVQTARRSEHLSIVNADGEKIKARSSESFRRRISTAAKPARAATSRSKSITTGEWDAKHFIKVLAGMAMLICFI